MVSSIDWNIVFGAIQSIAIIVASLVAIRGINSWREETKWKGKYEMAFEVLSLFYEAQENIRIIRNPASSGTEGKTRKRRENETNEESERLDMAFVARERFEEHQEPFIKLKSFKPRFRALFGNGSEKPFDEIVKLMNHIFLASNFLGTRYWKEQHHRIKPPEEFIKFSKKQEEYEAVIWRNLKEPDDIEVQVDAIIAKIESYCIPILSKK